MHGSHGETRFVSPDLSLEKLLKQRSLNTVYESDILEWYRVQYNLSIKDEKFLLVTEEEAMEDFYRRQYYHEIQFGLRKGSNTGIEFLMPSFPLLKQFGGVLPSPNGYSYTDSDTVSKKDLMQAKNSIEEYEEEDDDEVFHQLDGEMKQKTSDVNPNVPPHLKQKLYKPTGGLLRSEKAEYGLEDQEFWKMIEEDEKASEEEDNWEMIQSIDENSAKGS